MIRKLLHRFGLWLAAKTWPSPPDGVVINLAAAHAGYVARYAKHAKYGDPDRPIVGVNTGRAYNYASAMENRRSRVSQGDAE
jgi:hypothetical protein